MYRISNNSKIFRGSHHLNINYNLTFKICKYYLLLDNVSKKIKLYEILYT